MRALCALVFAIVSGCSDDRLSATSAAVSSYSNCVGGCPEGQYCIGWYDQGYCTPLCDDHADCRTGCCATSASGPRACGPFAACINECQWTSRLPCVTTEVTQSQSCGSYTITVTNKNECSDPVRVYSCITDRNGTWDCRSDERAEGLPPGESFVHEVCESGGYSYVWATSFATFEEHACLWPLP